MTPWCLIKPSTGHFDGWGGVGGVLTLPDPKHAPMDRANTPQWAVASVRSPGDPFHLTKGEKILFGACLLVAVPSCFMILVSWACGLNGYGKKLFAQAFFWILFWVGVLFVAVFLAKTFWNWLP